MKSRACVVGVLLLNLSGCLHVTSKVPGVLDLRSDGADAPINTEPLPTGAARTGFDGFAYGAGVAGQSDVQIEDRNHFVLALIPIANESSTEEWQMALGDGHLRNVSMNEQYGVMTFFVAFVKGLVPVVGGFIQGTWDVRAKGTRIAGGAAAVRDESLPPPSSADTDTGTGY